MYIEEHNDRSHVKACDNDANSENEEERFMEAFRAFDKDCDGFLKCTIAYNRFLQGQLPV